MDNARSQQAALKLSAIATAIALVIGGPMATQAQEDDDQNLEEIVVTGTRIKQREDYVSPNPVTTFDAHRMENLGSSTSPTPCRRSRRTFRSSIRPTRAAAPSSSARRSPTCAA